MLVWLHGFGLGLVVHTLCQFGVRDESYTHVFLKNADPR